MSVIEDANVFFNVLFQRYNINMFENTVNRQEINYFGEAYSFKGERFLISVTVRQDKTMIQVFNVARNRKFCIFQKVYSTKNDVNALSKSTSLFKFLDKTL